MEELKKELEELKKISLIGVKTALNMSDIALLTGLSKSHIYKLTCAKKIPHYKSDGGKLTFFEKSEIEKWMLKNRVKTTDEIESEAINYVLGEKKGGNR